MASSENVVVISDFYRGIVRDKRSPSVGAALNLEEIDILDNEDYMQVEYGMESETSEITPIYDFSENVDYGDNFWAYGGANQQFELADFDIDGSGFGGFFEEFGSPVSDENAGRPNTEIEVYRTSEDSNLLQYTDWLYFVAGDDGDVPTIERYNITDDGPVSTVDSDLEGSENVYNNDVPVIMRIVNGELYILYSNIVNRVTTDGTYYKDANSNPALTLPDQFYCVDLTTAGRQSESMFVLASPNIDADNKSRGYWIDLATLEIQDYVDIPYGKAQWVETTGTNVMMGFVEDGLFRMMQLSQPYPGATVVEMDGIKLNNIYEPQTDVFDQNNLDRLAIQPSPAKSVHVQDGHVHFILNKKDAPGVYSVGRIDSEKNYGIRLEHRFPGDFPNQLGLAMGVYGDKKIVSYIDGYDGTRGSGTEELAVVTPEASSTTRSSDAVYESTWLAAEDPLSDKSVETVHVVTNPLPANTEIKCYVAQDYEDSYDQIYLADGSNMNTQGMTLGAFKAKPINDAQVFRVKLEIAGDGDNSPKITDIGFIVTSDNYPAYD